MDVVLDPTPICSNMTNREFRDVFVSSRATAVTLTHNRIKSLARWDYSEQARAKKWFGSSSEEVRAAMTVGLPKLLDVVRNLKPENVIRWDQQRQRNITCTVCTSPEAQLWKGNKVFTLIHECTHFTDVFDSTDDMYGISVGLSLWAQTNPGKAIKNADSITCYVGFED
ncbi:M35 family metallo-endopeptidase [Paraburkholderia sp. SIMBA_053]|uniref:M35 family metallo-endopeptidase n=1 Tax=Paraburkholderia sp. SIMBA_053 TaxID=3085794 RepID=UPI00397CF6A2